MGALQTQGLQRIFTGFEKIARFIHATIAADF
jgi:hypothetical protein